MAVDYLYWRRSRWTAAALFKPLPIPPPEYVNEPLPEGQRFITAFHHLKPFHHHASFFFATFPPLAVPPQTGFWNTQTVPLLQNAATVFPSGTPAIIAQTQHIPLILGFPAVTDLGAATSVSPSARIATTYEATALATGFAPLALSSASIEHSVVGIFRTTPITEQRPSDASVQTSQGGIVRTLDSGVSWHTRTTSNIQGSAVRSVAYAPSDGLRAYAGANNGQVLASTDGGLTWTPTNTVATAANGLAVHPTDPDTVWAATSRGAAISTDGGVTWTLRNSGISPAPGGGSIPLSVVIDPSDGNTIYLAGISMGVYKSINAGILWERASIGLPGAPANLNCRQLIITSSAILYARIDSNGVYKTTDSAATWADSSTGLSSLTTTSIAFDPSDITKLYVGSAGNVDRSTDSGATWTAAGTADGLPSALGNYIVGVSDDGATVYAGLNSANHVGERRLSKSTDGGATWADSHEGFPAAVVNALAGHPSVAAQLLAATNKDGATGVEIWVAVQIGTETSISQRSRSSITVPLATASTLAADLQTRIDAGPVRVRVQQVQQFRGSVKRYHTLGEALITRVQLADDSESASLIISAFETTTTRDFEEDGNPIVLDRTLVTGAETRAAFPEITMVLDPTIRVGSTIQWDAVDYVVRAIKYDLTRVNRLMTIGTRGVTSATSTAENTPDVLGSITQAQVPRLRSRPERALMRGARTGQRRR